MRCAIPPDSPARVEFGGIEITPTLGWNDPIRRRNWTPGREQETSMRLIDELNELHDRYLREIDIAVGCNGFARA